MKTSGTAGRGGDGSGGATGMAWWRRWLGGGGRQVVREAADDRGWRSVWTPSGSSERDLSPLDWRNLLLQAYETYCQNPLAYAIVEQSTNFVLGGGVRVVARDFRVQRAVDRFWHDPENRMDQRVYAIQTELSLFGEQFVRFFVDPLTGRTVIRQLDPLYVEQIETDPHDVDHPLRYLYRPPSSPFPGRSEQSPLAHPSGGQAPTLQPPDTGPALLGGGEWVDAGDVLHVAINKVSNALRGRSDLAPLLPWLRRYGEWLEDRVRINKLKGAFLFDVTVEAAQQADIDRIRAANATAPQPGTVLFHNDREVWKPVQPEIGADDAKEDGRALRLLIAAGAGVPEHYLSEGGNANRATAAEMGLPAIKRFQRRQEVLRDLLRRVVERVIAEQARVGRIGPRADRSFTVEFDELGDARTGRGGSSGRGPSGGWTAADGTALPGFTGALATAADRGWVSPAEARRLWWRFAGDADGADERTGRTSSE